MSRYSKIPWRSHIAWILVLVYFVHLAAAKSELASFPGCSWAFIAGTQAEYLWVFKIYPWLSGADARNRYE